MWLRMGVGRMRIDGQPRDMITTVLDAFAAVSERNRQVDGHRAHQLQAAGAARLPQLRRRVRVVRAPCGERAAAV